MNKTIPTLVVTACIAWLVYKARDLIQLLVYAATQTSTEEVSFPLGENKKVSFELDRSFIKKPYAIALRTEFIDGEKRGGRSAMFKKLDYPYHFTVKGYKLSGKKKELIFEEVFTQDRKTFRINGSGVSNPQNIAFSTKIHHMKLPAGKYSFEAIDHSAHNPFYKTIQISLSVFVYVKK